MHATSWGQPPCLLAHPPHPPALLLTPPRCRYIDMVTRDKDDPRNKEEGERGPRGVRMVVEDDLVCFVAADMFQEQMEAPGSPMFEELSKMMVGWAGDFKGEESGLLGHQPRAGFTA